MRYVGRIADWNDEKGFGFVAPNGGGDRAFVHVKAFERMARRPITGDLVSYELRKDGKGRYTAAGIRFAAQRSKKNVASTGRRSRKLLATLFLLALAVGWLVAKIPAIVPVVYVAMSAVSFVLYGADKSAATNNRWRTQESVLHIADLLGGWPGALFAQDVFRHKISKASFQTMFWFTVVLNCGVLVWLLKGGKASVANGMLFG